MNNQFDKLKNMQGQNPGIYPQLQPNQVNAPQLQQPYQTSVQQFVPQPVQHQQHFNPFNTSSVAIPPQQPMMVPVHQTQSFQAPNLPNPQFGRNVIVTQSIPMPGQQFIQNPIQPGPIDYNSVKEKYEKEIKSLTAELEVLKLKTEQKNKVRSEFEIKMIKLDKLLKLHYITKEEHDRKKSELIRQAINSI